jgi:hypothetical protein
MIGVEVGLKIRKAFSLAWLTLTSPKSTLVPSGKRWARGRLKKKRPRLARVIPAIHAMALS